MQRAQSRWHVWSLAGLIALVAATASASAQQVPNSGPPPPLVAPPIVGNGGEPNQTRDGPRDRRPVPHDARFRLIEDTMAHLRTFDEPVLGHGNDALWGPDVVPVLDRGSAKLAVGSSARATTPD